MRVDDVWNFARERHSVYLRRAAGAPAPWTTDPVIGRYKFTNVYRELDRTTQWFVRYVRDPLKQQPEVLLATVLFRWFNRVRTGEAIFLQQQLLGPAPAGDDYATAWAQYAGGAPVDVLRAAVRGYCGRGPYVTGAFMVKTPDGMQKLDGVLWCVEQFKTRTAPAHPSTGAGAVAFGWREVAEGHLAHPGDFSLEWFHHWLTGFPYMGSFMAAQVVADLKYTALLDKAPDWHTWAASGPGSRRGLNLACGRPVGASWREADWLSALQQLREALLPRFVDAGWPAPHAQDVQNICCEFSKYTRGSSRNRYP